MFRLPSLTPAAHRPLTPWRRAVLFGAGLLVLWLALQLAPSAPPAPSAPSRSALADERLPDRAGFATAERLGEVATRPSRSLLRPGNVLALLLLVGGGAGALYLRKRRPGTEASDDALPMAPLGSLVLAPGQSLRLVRVGDEVLLLGLAQGGVSLLRRYDADEAPVGLDATEAGAGMPDFAALLRHVQTPQAHG